MNIGFIGLGVMGQPMAQNLLRAGASLVVWNRSPDSAKRLARAGALVAPTSEAVFAQARIVILMLANADAIDAVLRRGTPGFEEQVRGRVVAAMGTTSPAYSQALERDIIAAGGRYVEAPVSGSRKPAEAAQLVGLLAGDPESVQRVQPHLAPMCREQFVCGAVPSALRMKLAVNVYLLTMVPALAEAFHFAQRGGLDLEQFRSILDASPMASDVSKVKLGKLVAGNFEVQAALRDALMNAELVAAAAHDAGIPLPQLDEALAQYRRASALGHENEDMIAVVHAIAAAGRPQG